MQDHRGLRISLLTCGVDDKEVWELFGHTGVRVIDSNRHTDLVYNYGTFEFSDDYEVKFLRGKLLYNISVSTFAEFMPEYIEAGRSVEEQELILDGEQKMQIQEYLENNLLPANRYYKYDYFFDNCATRVRDIFPKTLGHGFKYKNVLPYPKISIRDIMNQYFYGKHWERMGVNILLGSRIDKPMTNDEIMFLPDFLRDGLAGATLNNIPVSTKPVSILKWSPSNSAPPLPLNPPFLLNCVLLLLTIASISVKQLKWLGRVMNIFLMLVTGILGCLILVMWFGTNHQACANNFNLLWLLPTNVLVVFTKAKGKGRYALLAMVLIFVTLLLHIVKIQQVTLFELSPLLVSLLLVYWRMFMKSRQ